MKFQNILKLFLCFALLMPSAALAFETDQYNLPTVPLADIGDEVSDYAEQNIREAVEKVNRQIAVHQRCFEQNSGTGGCGSLPNEKAKLDQLRSADTIVREVFRRLGGGIPPFTNAGTFMEKHRFNAQPSRYKTSFADSVLKRIPINYLTISDTVKIYGAEFGTDKVAHFYQQGYSYYKIRERAVAKNIAPAEADRKAVKFGQKTERTIYGTLISGVYSNADLCANFVGMRFYQNLTDEITINSITHPPILILTNGLWQFNQAVQPRTSLVKPFLDRTLNEALNPSIYTNFLGFRASARRVVREKSCPQWRKNFPDLTAADYRRQSEDLHLWNGEDYGYTESGGFITIADTCFSDEN